MNENTFKSIISALSGAIFVLLVTLLVLFLTDSEDVADEQVARTIISENKEKPQVEEAEPVLEEAAEEVKDAFDAFGVLDRKEEKVDEVSIRQAMEEGKSKAENVTEPKNLKPLVEQTESNALAQLDSIIENQKEKLEFFETKPEENKREKPVKEEAPQKPMARKSTTPEETEPTQTISSTQKISDLESLVLNGKSFFNTSSDEFNKVWLKKTDALWTDNIRSSARTTTKLSFADFTSLETVFTFRKSKLKKLTLMVYNKGDIGFITRSNFEDVKNDVLNKMTAFLGEKPLFKPNAGITRNNIYFWNIENVLYKLEYSFTETSKDFLSEYIRVVVTKGHSGINVINIDQIDTDVLREADLREMVDRESNGDVIINGIPMVDQGEKGYCACAALARLMIYFGRDFDQHDIAKLAESTGSEGSDPKSLKKAIETMSAMLRLNMKVLAKCYLSDTSDSKTKEQLVNILEGQTMNYLNADVFKKMAYGNRRFKEFSKNVMSSIDRGRPVAWALEVGMVPEKGIPQSSGGHMRIITGYNKAKEIIYYTDSWGAGHEKKSMDMNAAFFVSYAFWEISPR